MPDLVLPETAARLQQRLVELFVQLCEDPDSVEAATEAARTLDELDAVLTPADR